MYCTVAARQDSLMSDPQARRLGSLPHTSISYKPCSRKRIPSGALLSIQILALQIMLQIISIINNQHHYHLTKSFKKYWKSVHNRCARVIYTPWWHMAYDIVTIWQFDVSPFSHSIQRFLHVKDILNIPRQQRPLEMFNCMDQCLLDNNCLHVRPCM